MKPVKHTIPADGRETCSTRTVHRTRVARAKREALDRQELNRLAWIFKILGDETRLRIVMALAGGDMCVCDLAAFLGLTESGVSHQLRRLKEHQLVKPRREGQVIYYALDDEHVSQLLETGLVHVRE